MHFSFMINGKFEEVEILLRDMRAQKHLFPFWKGKKKQGVYMEGQIRILPFGIYEYVFAKEDLDAVLNTLIIHKDRYELGNLKLAMLRKMVKCDKIPDYKKDKKFLWLTQNVRIIPIGIREDAIITDPKGPYKGWTHEAI